MISLALGLAACNGDSVGESHPASNCSVSFESAQSDASLRETFVEALIGCDKTAIQAKDSGYVVGFLFAPDSARLRADVMKAYRRLGYSQADIEVFANVSVSNSIETQGFAMAAITPTDFNYFGVGLPVHVLFFPIAFTWPNGILASDMKSILAHELQHARDWKNGIRIGPHFVGQESIASHSAGMPWTVQLMELRAVYRELDLAYEPKARVDSFHIGPAWFASQASAYARHWKNLDSLAATEFEIRAVTAQKQEYRGIVPETRADSLLLKFNLYGRSLMAVFRTGATAKSGTTRLTAQAPIFQGWLGEER